jgi:fluoride exporter
MRWELFAATRRQAGFVLPACRPDFTGVNVLSYMWIAIGSTLGGMGRYWISGLVAQQFGETFPWGTIIVNVTGSFIIGFFATLTGPDGRFLVSTPARQFVMVGLCGGYTTFSSFSLQTLNQAREGDWLGAGANIGVSVLLCLFAVWLGHTAALALNQLKGA